MKDVNVLVRENQLSANFNMRSSSVYDGQCIHNGEQYSKRRRTNEQYTIYLVRVEEFHPNVRLTTHVRGFSYNTLNVFNPGK